MSESMFATGSGESGRQQLALRETELPHRFKFLGQPCLCKRRVCYQQFISQVEAVQAKQQEFCALAAHEKALFQSKKSTLSLTPQKVCFIRFFPNDFESVLNALQSLASSDW